MNVPCVRINKYKLLVSVGESLPPLFHCSASSHHQQLTENRWRCIGDEEDGQKCAQVNKHTCMSQPPDHSFLSSSVFLARQWWNGTITSSSAHVTGS